MIRQIFDSSVQENGMRNHWKGAVAGVLSLIVSQSAVSEQQCLKDRVHSKLERYAAADPSRYDSSTNGPGGMIELFRSAKGLQMSPTLQRLPGRYHGDDYRRFLKRLEDLGYKPADYGMPRWLRNDCGVEYAAYRLEKLISDLGEGHLYLNFWVESRAAVFNQCSSSSNFDLPENPTTFQDRETFKVLWHDRAYWEAALAYYRHDHEIAFDQFTKISNDVASPHRFAAQISMVRILADQGELDDANQKLIDLRKQPGASGLIRYFQQSMAGSIANLDRTEERRNEHLAAISKVLQMPGNTLEDGEMQGLYRYAISDIQWYIAHLEPLDWWLRDEIDLPNTTRRAVRELARTDELVDWLQSMKAGWYFHYRRPWTRRDHSLPDSLGGRSISDHAYHRYESGDGIHWLLPMAGRMLNTHPKRDEFLTVFRSLHDRVNDCTATETDLLFHGPMMVQAVRLLVTDGDLDEALSVLMSQANDWSVPHWAALIGSVQWLNATGQRVQARRFWKLSEGQNFSEVNNVGPWGHSLHLLNAEREEDFLELFRKDKAYFSRLGSDGIAMLTMLPVEVLATYSGGDTFTKERRAELIRIAWTRAHALSDFETRDALIPQLVLLNPSFESEIKAIRALPAGDARERRIALFLLRTPSMRFFIASWSQLPKGEEEDGRLLAVDRYDHNDMNWWCALDLERSKKNVVDHFFGYATGTSGHQGVTRYEIRYARDFPPGEPLEVNAGVIDEVVWKHPLARKIDWSELETLSKVDGAPKLLSRTVLDWASDFEKRRSRATDEEEEQLAEALHRAVTATRYGCQRGQGHGSYSSKAHQALHRLFPKSEWTRKTPYWFDYQHFRSVHRYRVEQERRSMTSR